MKFHWWWTILAVVSFWIVGWLFSSLYMLFFDPEASISEERKNWSGRLVGSLVVNWLLWPALLPALRHRNKLHRDMKTGKRPSWIVLAENENSSREWILSDGTTFSASVSGYTPKEKCHISADYFEDELIGRVEYRLRMIAPTTATSASEWFPMKFKPRPPKPKPEDEDAVDSYVSDRYEASVKLPRGKHEVEFRVENRSGRAEECSSITLIVADNEDYNL